MERMGGVKPLLHWSPVLKLITEKDTGSKGKQWGRVWKWRRKLALQASEWKLYPNYQIVFLDWNKILDMRLNSKNCGLLPSGAASLGKCLCSDDSQVHEVTLPLAQDLYQVLMNHCFQLKTAESKNLKFEENSLMSCHGGCHDILGVNRTVWC